MSIHTAWKNEGIKNMITVKVDGYENELSFTQVDDNWYVNTTESLAVDTVNNLCITHPWFADYLCEAPVHEFEIINGH